MIPGAVIPVYIADPNQQVGEFYQIAAIEKGKQCFMNAHAFVIVIDNGVPIQVIQQISNRHSHIPWFLLCKR
ncbi:hypothetical protein CFR76_15030 [Komagataeibacter swingsii]|uniref:Uncharacterized protein n=1 Tax=Komagataeibacter swingsii TaxID=215220 RepID=A0A2V4S023_9PROT|nr:hypothetical protein CFR76_15030 [Komagataeibacter swingsii]